VPDSEKSRVVIVGASGHAKVVIDIFEKQRLNDVALIIDDDPSLTGSLLFGYPVSGTRSVLLELARQHGVNQAIVAIGNNDIRAEISDWLENAGFTLVSAVHPSAQIGRGVMIGSGTVVMAGAVINSDARIGKSVIVNTGATIDHDCMIDDGAHIAPGCHVCGGVVVGGRSLVGAGTTIIPNIRVGQNAVVGAGSTLIRDVPDGTKVAGSPARKIGS
jgi:sugar O-acyltransferase (sialic acid O-acetyltransferase NeuD family)